ncbi:putative sulfate exporter family transporter [Tumebacillus sp. DT12]|uniref:Sulfate exporter family transporter n=1 Tax=Tumebacillus lacus TaxID=2995335 RepID=A0ABT3X637_9BACL|nr:putative sulfate exporter family transporter [Tumebacillus lacus]MCX7572371.1 putative sulfate exporter family transporter [Tumebacillus lacus]
MERGTEAAKETARTAGRMAQQDSGTARLHFVGGVVFTGLVAVLGFALSKVPGFAYMGPMACSLLLAMAFRQVAGYPEPLRNGIAFSSKKLLRVAIVLYGLKLNIDVVLAQGLGLLGFAAVTIVFSLLVTMWLAKWWKADTGLSLLLGVGTGVCGAAAIAAVTPIVKAKEEDTAVAMGMITLIGTVLAVLYTVVGPLLPMSATEYGVWAGLSLHELAQVALAGAPLGANALGMALLAKLSRVFLLLPLCLVLILWQRRRGKGDEARGRVEFPWFLVGFLVMSVFGSYVWGPVIPEPQIATDAVAKTTTFLMSMAMVGMGLNVSLRELRSKALRPLAVLGTASILLTVLTYFIAVL